MYLLVVESPDLPTDDVVSSRVDKFDVKLGRMPTPVEPADPVDPVPTQVQGGLCGYAYEGGSSSEIYLGISCQGFNPSNQNLQHNSAFPPGTPQLPKGCPAGYRQLRLRFADTCAKL